MAAVPGSRVAERVMRDVLVRMGASERTRSVVVRAPLTRDVVTRFVPGESQEQALDAARDLAAGGLRTSIDVLGEYTRDQAMATEAAQRYVDLLRVVGDEGLADMVEVSLKLSAVGQALPVDGERIAHENAHRVCAAASAVGTTVTLDMEDHTTTDSTLGILHELRLDFPDVGAVLQAGLRRTEADCRHLSGPGSRVRLCKGAYAEPASVAFTDRRDVDSSYQRCLRVLMNGQGYPMVATHDPQMVQAAQELATASGRGTSGFEFQMLYGIRPLEQQRLADEGNRVRIYLPFGVDWYGYFMRRLAERPANVGFFLRSLAGRR